MTVSSVNFSKLLALAKQRLNLIAYAFLAAAGAIVLWTIVGWFGSPSLPTCPEWGVHIAPGTSCFRLSGVYEQGLDVRGRMDLQMEGNGRYLIFNARGLAHDFLAGPDACVIVQPPDIKVQFYQGSVIHMRVMEPGENPPTCFFKP